MTGARWLWWGVAEQGIGRVRAGGRAGPGGRDLCQSAGPRPSMGESTKMTHTQVLAEGAENPACCPHSPGST